MDIQISNIENGLIFGALLLTLYAAIDARAGQRDLQKLTVGYTPISGARTF